MLHNRSLLLFMQLPCALLSVTLFFSCAKTKYPPPPTSLIIVSGLPVQNPMVTDLSNDGLLTYHYAKRIDYKGAGNNALNTTTNNVQPVKLYLLPDTLEKDKPLYDLSLDLSPGSMNTLFLTGTQAAPDTVFRKENFPFIKTEDSAFAARFINLSYGSSPVTISIREKPGDAPVVSDLSYKQLSGFSLHKIGKKPQPLTFDVKDAATGELLASINVLTGNAVFSANMYYRNITFVFCGVPGTTGLTKPDIFRVFHSLQ